MAEQDNQPFIQVKYCNLFFHIEITHQEILTEQPQQYVTQQALPSIIKQGVTVIEGPINGPLCQLICERHRTSVLIECPYCQQKGNTVLVYEMGEGSWICVLLFFCFCCYLCWLPCTDKDYKDVNHHCKFCNQLVGICKYHTCE